MQSIHIKTNDSVALPVWTCVDRWASIEVGTKAGEEDVKTKGKKRVTSDATEDKKNPKKKRLSKDSETLESSASVITVPAVSDIEIKQKVKKSKMKSESVKGTPTRMDTLTISDPPLPKRAKSQDEKDILPKKANKKDRSSATVTDAKPKTSKLVSEEEETSNNAVESKLKGKEMEKPRDATKLLHKDHLVTRSKPKKEKESLQSHAHTQESEPVIASKAVGKNEKKKSRVSFAEVDDVSEASKSIAPLDVKKKKKSSMSEIKKNKITGGISGKSTSGKSVKDKAISKSIRR